MIIKREAKPEEIFSQNLKAQEVPFEVRLQPVQISEKAIEAKLDVKAPVERQTAIQAAGLIQQLMLHCTATSHHAHANARREKVKLLLEDEK